MDEMNGIDERMVMGMYYELMNELSELVEFDFIWNGGSDE